MGKTLEQLKEDRDRAEDAFEVAYDNERVARRAVNTTETAADEAEAIYRKALRESKK